MGLGYHTYVHRLDGDDATRCSYDSAHLAARFRRGAVKAGERIHKDAFSWVQWLRDAVAAGEGVVLEQAGGVRGTYPVRGHRCPPLGAAGLNPREWLCVELWDEG